MKTCWLCPLTHARRARYRIWRKGSSTPIHVCAHHAQLMLWRDITRTEEIRPIPEDVGADQGVGPQEAQS